MTIASLTNRVSYVGNGVTTAFSYPYYLFAPADLIVLEVNLATGAETVKTITTHYTVSGTPDANGVYSNGVTVTAVVAPANTVKWVIIRDPALTQPVLLVANDPLPVKAGVELPLDRLTLFEQRARELTGRSLRQAEGDGAALSPFPSVVARINSGNGSIPLFDGVTGDVRLSTQSASVLETYLLDSATVHADRIAADASAAAAAAISNGQYLFEQAKSTSAANSLEEANVPAVVKVLYTAGYRTKGVGACLRVRGTNTPGAIQSLDGAYWEVAGNVFAPEMFGAVIGATDSAGPANLALALLAVRGGGEIVFATRGTYTCFSQGVDPYHTDHHACIVVPQISNITFTVKTGVRLKLADAQMTGHTFACNLITFNSKFSNYWFNFEPGHYLDGNAAGQIANGWVGGDEPGHPLSPYAQVVYNNGLIGYGVGGGKNITISGITGGGWFSSLINNALGLGASIDNTGTISNWVVVNVFSEDCGEGPQLSGVTNVFFDNWAHYDLNNTLVGDGTEISNCTTVRGGSGRCYVQGGSTKGAGSLMDLGGSVDVYLPAMTFEADAWTSGVGLEDAPNGRPDKTVIGAIICRNMASGVGGVCIDGNKGSVTVGYVELRDSQDFYLTKLASNGTFGETTIGRFLCINSRVFASFNSQRLIVGPGRVDSPVGPIFLCANSFSDANVNVFAEGGIFVTNPSANAGLDSTSGQAFNLQQSGMVMHGTMRDVVGALAPAHGGTPNFDDIVMRNVGPQVISTTLADVSSICVAGCETLYKTGNNLTKIGAGSKGQNLNVIQSGTFTITQGNDIHLAGAANYGETSVSSLAFRWRDTATFSMTGWYETNRSVN